MSCFSCFFYESTETLTYFLFQMNFVCQPSTEIFHPLHFDLHMQMLEQQISGSQKQSPWSHIPLSPSAADGRTDCR